MNNGIGTDGVYHTPPAIVNVLLPEDFVGKCVRHFTHACDKHPKFCNGLLPHEVESDATKESDANMAQSCLRFGRQRLEAGRKIGNILWNELLDCEVWEATNEMIARNKPAAIEELYDCIAVLMRTICVLEGKEQLTKEVCE